MFIFKIFIGFAVIALLETLNGIFRVKVLSRFFAGKLSRIVSFVSGSVLITAASIMLIPIVDPDSLSQALFTGIAWAFLMACYDIIIGRFAFRLSWPQIIDDFNVMKGNLLSFGLLLIIIIQPLIYLFIK